MFTLQDLPYSYDALEPYIDELTMHVHHDKHHAAYTNKLNDAVVGTELESLSIEELLSQATLTKAVRNNGGGYYNHNLYWMGMSPDHTEPSKRLLTALSEVFGSLESFKEKFSKAAIDQFGSGWAWLVKTESGLEISSTPNQDNPLMRDVEVRGTPLLALDVWEHAYYLKYRNMRADYIQGWWSVVNWERVEELMKY